MMSRFTATGKMETHDLLTGVRPIIYQSNIMPSSSAITRIRSIDTHQAGCPDPRGVLRTTSSRVGRRRRADLNGTRDWVKVREHKARMAGFDTDKVLMNHERLFCKETWESRKLKCYGLASL